MNPFQRTQLRHIAELYLAKAQGGHRLDHTRRVVHNVRWLMAGTATVDEDVLEAAAWLHDIGRSLEGVDGRSHAVISAELAGPELLEMGFPLAKVRHVRQVIAEHRFSEGKAPESLEGQILQDADRLDAVGAIGIARTFATGCDRDLYHSADPFGEHRELDDTRYAVDHFYAKLLKLPETMHTPQARKLAAERVAFMQAYLQQLAREIGGE